MTKIHFIGIDVSKNTLDIALVSQGTLVLNTCVANTVEGMQEALTVLGEQVELTRENCLFCMEHTGSYCQIATSELWGGGYDVWVESALRINRSIGLYRGKSDRVDAERIAMYAFRHSDRSRLWVPPNKVLQVIKQLQNTRNAMVKAKAQLKQVVECDAGFVHPSHTQLKHSACRGALEALDKDIADIQRRILNLVERTPEINRLFTIVTSVTGIGDQTAIDVLIATDGFNKLKNPREMACYAGVAPFEHTSGSSIRGRTRVSHMANKDLKKRWHMAALVAIQHDKGLKRYYQRKVKEGKPKMAVINNVRNKLIHRMYACVNEGRTYDPEYLPQAA